METISNRLAMQLGLRPGDALIVVDVQRDFLPGAEWAGGLRVPPHAEVISKGTDPLAEAYSGFSGTALRSSLQRVGVRRVFVGGLATDYCVCATVCDALAQGLEVVLLADAVRAVNVQPGDETRAVQQMTAQGARLFRSTEPLSG